jgi:hypothetical protein
MTSQRMKREAKELALTKRERQQRVGIKIRRREAMTKARRTKRTMSWRAMTKRRTSRRRTTILIHTSTMARIIMMMTAVAMTMDLFISF